eukprot:CAMPEP_0184368214 /NCGR_PEP_ID=MMETSP1089-20130417/161517_1 /TAXON_ID=38269 ORGANISM="Gloeochaete wittrockiana, Strain SAG46.84" /NCGR_SAMPLE_ID=MMETSP1089 /ASSEMBLY_ACC=CAM_ASM_000445 /LENGTH=321 /DNA_ID=CAMNT_0026710427 /DNA_START=266 /DNA_END=1231 /DNA_ORIENTATION=-
MAQNVFARVWRYACFLGIIVLIVIAISDSPTSSSIPHPDELPASPILIETEKTIGSSTWEKSLNLCVVDGEIPEPSQTAKELDANVPSQSQWSKLPLHDILFKDRVGLEIGGLSGGTFGAMNFYELPSRLDNLNFAGKTLWENVADNSPFTFSANKPPGLQMIKEGTNLTGIPNETYDFVLSSHSLEHTSNPLKAISEWRRVLKQGGALFLIVPDKRYTFDNRRQTADMEHLVRDFKADLKEDDLGHMEEIIRDHDLAMDPPAGNTDQFRERSRKNYENRGLHQHVFNFSLLSQICECLRFKIVHMENVVPFHQTLIALKM